VLTAQESARVVVPVLSMEDQFKQVHDVKQHRGDVLVLIYGDQESAKANSQLGERIHVHYHPSAKGQPPAKARTAPVKPVPGAAPGARSPDVKSIPIACVGKRDTEVARAIIRRIIKNNAPEVPIWLDFLDAMKAQFPYKPGVPNVVVLDALGRYRYAAAGQPTAEGIERLIGVIDQLRKEAVEKR
jgi:hypothetical protein